MSDYGTKTTDKAIAKLDRKIKSVYEEAQVDVQRKMDDFNDKFRAKDKIYRQKLSDGEITKEQYDNWLSGQVFQGNQWKQKKRDITYVLTNSNSVATKMVNKESIGVFVFNANYQSYSVEHDSNINFGFDIYDESTVTNLIKNDPKMLPEWKIDEPKDYVWNEKKVNTQITLGIIEGESLDEIAERLSVNLSSQNFNHMRTFARTAMTGAQNAGRYQSLMKMKEMGINVVKEWMATLDNHTRDSHRHMDGEQQKVGDKWHPFKFSNGLRYPGDPEGPAREVYNCRCTLVGDLPDYPEEYERYDNIDGKPVENMTYDEWYQAKKKKKDQEELIKKYGSIGDAQNLVDQLKNKVSSKGADKVFTGIWADDVTYADWEEKKDSIQGKRDYYNEKLPELKQKFIDRHLYDVNEEDARKIVEMLSNDEYTEFSELWNDNSEYLMRIGYDPASLFDIYNEFNDGLAGKRIKRFNKYLRELDEFEKNGEEYYRLLSELRDAENRLKEIKKAYADSTGAGKFGPDAYSQERKDNAVWAKSTREADKALRKQSGETWRNATDEEREAIYEYTQSYHKFNEPLRGYEYGTGRFLGVGKTDLNAGYADNGDRLNAMTRIINKCEIDHDQWFQRGCRYTGMDKFFQCDMDLLQYGTQEELERELLGKSVTEYGFMSMGSSKGYGFSGDVILNIYTPEGTKLMYVEPFSAFGNGSGFSWDGISEQSSYGTELETIMQQGTQFRVTKVERSGRHGTLYFDIEVIGQDDPQYWTGK